MKKRKGIRGGKELERNKGNKRKINNVSSGVGRGIMTQRGNKKGGNKRGENKNMIEIERKFKLSSEEKETLLEGATLFGEEMFVDVYFDTEDFTLGKNDIWLRRRGEVFELKIPVGQNQGRQTRQYQEISGAEKIREIFAVAPVLDFETDIKVFGYEIFCRLKTTRRKYQKEGLTIDLDVATSDLPGEQDFCYQVAEVELLVENKTETFRASEEIENFAKKNKLKTENIRGKVAEYLFRKRPKHFATLVEAGIVEAEI